MFYVFYLKIKLTDYCQKCVQNNKPYWVLLTRKIVDKYDSTNIKIKHKINFIQKQFFSAQLPA